MNNLIRKIYLPMALFAITGILSSCDKDFDQPPSDYGTIRGIRGLYQGSDVDVATGLKLNGIVISDASNGNVSTGNFIVQQGNYGIAVYVGSSVTIPYSLGDSVSIDLTGYTLTSYNNALELKSPSGITLPAAVASGKMVTPMSMTIKQLNASLTSALNSSDNHEYTLVALAATSGSGGSTFGSSTANTSRTLTDATGSIVLYTLKTASFANTSLPTTPKTWTGYAYSYKTTPEFIIRSTNDVN